MPPAAVVSAPAASRPSLRALDRGATASKPRFARHLTGPPPSSRGLPPERLMADRPCVEEPPGGSDEDQVSGPDRARHQRSVEAGLPPAASCDAWPRRARAAICVSAPRPGRPISFDFTISRLGVGHSVAAQCSPRQDGDPGREAGGFPVKCAKAAVPRRGLRIAGTPERRGYVHAERRRQQSSTARTGRRR
jgi:hypothetical protein